MGLRYDTRTDQPDVPVVDGRFWRGVVNGLIASVFCWSFIVFCAWLGYRISHYV